MTQEGEHAQWTDITESTKRRIDNIRRAKDAAILGKYDKSCYFLLLEILEIYDLREKYEENCV